MNLYTYWNLQSTNLHRTAFVQLERTKDQFHVFTPRVFPHWKNDQEIVRLFLNRLKKKSKSKPYFDFLFLGAPHDFSAPFPEQSKFQPLVSSIQRLKLSPSTPVKPILNLYKSSVFFLDQLIGKVLKALKEEGWMKNSVILITADHGKEVNRLGTGNWEHLTNVSDWQVRVPFVLSWPGKKSRAVNHVTSHVDLVPTLMQDLFHCKSAVQDYSLGKNLFDKVKDERYLLLFTWLQKAFLNGKEVYSFEDRQIKVLDSLTYDEKESSSKDFSFFLELMKKYEKAFF